MQLIGRALARLAAHAGGQLLLELPDDLPPSFVAEIMKGANEEVRHAPPFALFVHDREIGFGGIEPAVGFRELAMYRQGGHLAVTYATDNRGMATYTSVYPLLLAPGFPADPGASGAVGIAGLDGFLDQFCDVLLEMGAAGSVDEALFRQSVRHAARFLAEAHQAAGNGQATFATDWWLHLKGWTDNLLNTAGCEWSISPRARIYGCAGLPAPDGNSQFSMSAKDYLSVIEERWADPGGAQRELARLQGVPDAAEAAKTLADIDWIAAQERVSLRTDSPVARVAMAGMEDPGPSEAFVRGWAGLSVSAFKDSYLVAKGMLSVRCNGSSLPRPWPKALPILSAPIGSVGSDEVVRLDNFEILIPRKDVDSLDSAATALGEVTQYVSITGIRGSVVEFDISAVESTEAGLLLGGTLRVSPSKGSQSVVWLEGRVQGALSQSLADRADGAFLLLRPREMALLARPQGKTGQGSMRGPAIFAGLGQTACKLLLAGPGTYDFVMACGAEAAQHAGDILIGLEKPQPMEMGGAEEPIYLASIDVPGDMDVTIAGTIAFSLALAGVSERPRSPIVAAAMGVSALAETPIDQVPLGNLEQRMCEALAVEKEGAALGAFMLSSSRETGELVELLPGSWCAVSLQKRLTELTPQPPSQALLDHPSYRALTDAYRALGLPERLAHIDAESNSAGATISRIGLEFLEEDKVRGLLSTYATLVEESNSLSRSDQFWARHPFTVAVYPDRIGTQSLVALLLSPLHPVRLGWMWAVQVGLREAFADGSSPVAALALLDQSQFPARSTVVDEFDQPLHFVPVPIDAYPDEIYLGWEALAQITEQRVRVPEWVQGGRFPVAGLSALSASAVSSAIDDFLRVAPHVQALQIELESTEPTRRSTAIDEGVRSKVGALALASTSLDGVAGVRVVDSPNRKGPIPSFRQIEDAISLARPGFNAEWVSSADNVARHPHITFLEGTAATLAVVPGPAVAGSGWLARVPLRRFPVRPRQVATTDLDFRLGTPPTDDHGLWRAVRAYETGNGGEDYVTRIRPNLAALPRRPNWLVTGDFGVDPQTIAHASRNQGDGQYMLWDWRPAATVRTGGGAACLRAQPYFVLASVPKALSAAITSRLNKLNSSLDNEALAERTTRLVGTLADRAVGLNTLLAIGHHQATGALGFYFALRSLAVWMEQAPNGQARFVVPIDAVDPFLRSIPTSGDGSRKRADLLAVQVETLGSDAPRVVLVPIEIKHYGLNAQEEATKFPGPEEARLTEHLEQLRSYQRQLVTLCEAYRDATGSMSSILGQQLTAILEAAIQLSPKPSTPEVGQILASVASGEARLELGKGALLWYQPGASGADGEKASWEEVYGSLDARRVDVRVDPAAFDECFWQDAAGAAHDVLLAALDCATLKDEAEDPQVVSGAVSPAMVVVRTAANFSAKRPDAAESPDRPLADGPEGRVTASPDAHDVLVALNGGDASAPSNSPKAAELVPDGGHVVRTRIAPGDLEKRYNRLLAALAEFHVKVERPRGQLPYIEGPAFVEYSITPSYGVSVSKIESQLENLKLRLKLPADAVLGCSTHLGNVLITVPKEDHERYFVNAVEMWERWERPEEGFTVPLGEDMSGQIVELELSSSNSPHILIAGVTGSGKSEALLTLLHGAVRFYSSQELQLRLVDPKQTELNSLEHVEHNAGRIGFSGEDAIHLLEEAADEMDRRYEKFRSARVRDIEAYQLQVGPLPRWLIVLDEYADLTSDDDERKLIEKNLRRLAQKARAAGIHLIISTQKPIVQVLNSVVKGNLPGRIALRVNTNGESRVVLDDGGAEQLVGKGDALLKIGNSKVRLQFARYQP